MNAHLKASLESAERTLPESGQELLAQMVDAFTENFDRKPQADFSAEELDEIRQIDAEAFEEADLENTNAVFSRYPQ